MLDAHIIFPATISAGCCTSKWQKQVASLSICLGHVGDRCKILLPATSNKPANMALIFYKYQAQFLSHERGTGIPFSFFHIISFGLASVVAWLLSGSLCHFTILKAHGFLSRFMQCCFWERTPAFLAFPSPSALLEICCALCIGFITTTPTHSAGCCNLWAMQCQFRNIKGTEGSLLYCEVIAIMQWLWLVFYLNSTLPSWISWPVVIKNLL